MKSCIPDMPGETVSFLETEYSKTLGTGDHPIYKSEEQKSLESGRLANIVFLVPRFFKPSNILL